MKHVAPELLPLVTCAYSTPSSLFFGEDIIPSSEGVQQGDPLGPLLFCLAIHDLVQQLQSEFTVFFLDDSTLSGSLEEVLEVKHLKTPVLSDSCDTYLAFQLLTHS